MVRKCCFKTMQQLCVFTEHLLNFFGVFLMKYSLLRFAWIYAVQYSACTCANVKNVVVSILGLDSVNCNLGQLSSAWFCL